MKRIEEKDTDKIQGGSVDTMSGPIISALMNLIKLIKEAGFDIGSGARRIVESDMCPLE